MSIDPTALCSQWSAARKQLSQAIDAFETACNSLAALGFQAGDILDSAQPTLRKAMKNKALGAALSGSDFPQWLS